MGYPQGKNESCAGRPTSEGTNGLLFEDNKLVIGNGDGTLLCLDLVSKELDVIAKIESSIDGIIPLGNEAYLISEVKGKVGTYTRTKVLN